MKIETKFNVGDKVYYIENERLIALEITSNIKVKMAMGIYIGH